MENLYIDLSVYLLFFLLLINLTLVSYVKKPTGSDQVVHLLLIKLIRNNSHKFISRIKPFLIGDLNGYPQLFHWFLSFLSNKSLNKINKIIPVISNSLSLLIHLLFSYYISKQLNFGFQFILYSTLLFLSSAILFNKQNARNTGISGRSAGLILGQLYIVLVCMFLISGNLLYLPLLVLLSLTIIQTSLFTTQFLIFISLIVSIVFSNIWIISCVIMAFILFIFLFPKVSKIYFKWQWKHKKYYVVYETKTYLLAVRKSIWGDFIIGFWRKLRTDFKKGVFYFFYNPVIIIITGTPIIIFILYEITQNSLFSLPSKSTIYVLAAVSFSSVLIFIITSFKYTRFLGEPERYIDFTVISFSVLGAILFYNNPIIIIIAASIGFARIIIENFIAKLATSSKIDRIDEIKKIIFSDKDLCNIRLLSNNFEITKKLLNVESKFFYGWLFYLYDKYEPKEIFLEQGILNSKLFIPIIMEHSINYFILDTKYHMDIEEKNGLEFHKIASVDNYIIYQIVDDTKL